MSQPQRWWIGLIPLFFLWALAGFLETPRVEGDLLARSSALLATATPDMTRREARVLGRDILIQGEELRDGASQSAVGRVREAAGVRLVEANVPGAAKRSPYLFTASRNGNSVALGGFYPDDATHKAALAKVRQMFPGLDIVDQMQAGSGAPQSYWNGVEAALQQLARLSRGMASITDSTLAIEGVAASSDAYVSLIGAGRSLSAGLSAGRIAVQAPTLEPYTFFARRAGDAVRVGGAVPDIAMRDNVREALQLFKGAKVEEDLSFASEPPAHFRALVQHGLGLLARMKDGEFRLAGAGYHLTGVAVDQASYEALIAAVKSLPEGAQRGQISILPAQMDPFTWSVVRGADGKVVIEGGVASEDLRVRLLAEARRVFPGAVIEDRMGIASGAPALFEPAALLALGQTAQLKGGAALLKSNVWSFAGEAVDQVKANAIAAALKGLPQGHQLGELKLAIVIPQVSPFAWSIQKAADGALTLTGAVPDEATRLALLNLARKLYPGVAIADRMTIARTAPEGFARAASLAIEAIGRLTSGHLRLSDATLAAEGVARDTDGANAVASLLRALPAGWMLSSNKTQAPEPPPAPPVAAAAPTVPPAVAPPAAPPAIPAAAAPAAASAATPESAFNCAAAPAVFRTRIFFEEGVYGLRDDAAGELRKVAAALAACAQARVLLEGHTNSHGDRTANLLLSTLRSHSVSRWLQMQGVPLRRIEMLGYAWDRPLLNETSDEAAARNRRVEIVVR